MALIVLAIDALDPALVEHYEADAVKLARHDELDTFTYMFDRPHTGEVWPTIATGLHPREHGITKSGEAEWDNHLVEFVSKFTGHLPLQTRQRLGDIAQTTLGADWAIAETDAPSFLDGDNRETLYWPGVYNSEYLERLWKRVDLASKTDEPQQTFDRDLLSIAASKFGWVQEMIQHDPELVATHVHVVDLMGHAYGTNEAHYWTFYEWIDQKVADLTEQMAEDDELLLLSDHGMGTKWIDGSEDAGVHSMRAFVSSTINDDLPESVFEVREWVESHVISVELNETDLNLPEEQLRQLGYIE